MKKTLLIIMTTISLTACSKENKNKTDNKDNMNFESYIPAESKNIDRNNYSDKVLETIKHYNREPIYYLRISKQNCLVEVKINDVVDYKDYEVANVITPSRIGQILKSGKQNITVRLFPVGNLINEDMGLKNQPSTKLSDKTEVAISVVMMDNKSDKGFDDEKVIVEKVSPKEVAGKEYYEFSFTFDAEVPYQFEGWTKGQDLRKLDQKLVQKKALEYYEMIGKVHQNKDLDSWLKINFPLEKRIQGSFYSHNDELENLLEEFKTTQ